jgi:hypothetical protein
MADFQTPPYHLPGSSRRLRAVLALTVVLLTSVVCLFLSPHEYPGAQPAPICVSPPAGLIHERGLVSLVITNCLLSEDSSVRVSNWYYKKSPRLTPVDIPGYPYWRLGPLTVMLYQEVELPSPELLGGSRDSGQTAILSRDYYGLGWRSRP